MGDDKSSRSPWLATILSLLGIGIVGIGLAYSLQASADLGTARRTVGPSVPGVPVSQKVSGVPITAGQVVIGAVQGIKNSTIEVRTTPGGKTVRLQIGPHTQVVTTHGGGLSELKVGDVVIIQVSADGRSAQAIYAGQISVAGTPSVG